jgi:hypothetical protein
MFHIILLKFRQMDVFVAGISMGLKLQISMHTDNFGKGFKKTSHFQ